VSALEVLAEPNRRRILDLLRVHERAVGALVDALAVSQPAVSKHLRVLREAGLVEARVDGQRRLYRVRTEPLRELDDWLAPYRELWAPSLDALERHLETMETDMHGDLEPAGDGWRLRFTRRLSHPAEQVWRAITEAEHLQAWFPQRIVGEWTVGAPLRFEPPGGEFPGFDGEVLACEPPSLLEFRWGTDTIRLEISPHDGGCTLALIDSIDTLGKAVRDGAGWHVCLDALEHELDGTQPPWEQGERWREVHGDYVERFGPEASTIGPPERA
jgi:DNA-binding transcriptional ArsR family regulator/uncharacterized protein YndB with AHSA1/START domain